VDAPLSVLRERDLPPFAAAIAAGVQAIMPSHLRVPELTGDLPASLSASAQTGLLRGELGFTGVILSDALEMRAVSEPYGIPEAAVLAVIAGTDLLCLGRDIDQPTFLAVRTAIIEAVRSGRLPGTRLEDAAARVARLRAWTAKPALDDSAAGLGADQPAFAGDGRPTRAGDGRPTRAGDGRPTHLGNGAVNPIGLAAARRAIQVTGALPALHQPLVVQLVPPSNLAVGAVPWGLAAFVPAGSYREVGTATLADSLAGIVRGLLADAVGRSLIIVVRDAHRHPVAAQVTGMLLAARPDALLLEMGLPAWQPEAATYVATFGAARSNSRAAAETLGLIGQ
jgi:beta-N-acetylhexosaminidase